MLKVWLVVVARKVAENVWLSIVEPRPGPVEPSAAPSMRRIHLQPLGNATLGQGMREIRAQ